MLRTIFSSFAKILTDLLKPKTKDEKLVQDRVEEVRTIEPVTDITVSNEPATEDDYSFSSSSEADTETLTCGSCGTLIESGYYCDTCARRLNQ